MKKGFLFLDCILFYFLGINTFASSWMFQWDESTTTIEVPLGSNLQNYITKPKAKLYRDGQLLEDAQISYITTGDWLYLMTDVDTHQCGDYYVWYKAVESKYKPGQCQGYKTLITFKVVDLEKPKFTECPKELIYWVGSDKPNYLEQIIATDNSGNCKVILDDSLVDYDTPGIYQLIARASDQTNITEQEIKLIVKDPVGPVITFLGENNRILLTKGEEVHLQNYFNAVDKIDGDVTSSISYPKFTTEKEDSFELEVTFSDKNQNKSSIKVMIEIVDCDQVVIELYKESLILEYRQDFQKALKENIKHAYLGNKDISDEITIHTDKIKNEVGSYIVDYTYSYLDKEGKAECSLKLLSNTAPIILVENISIPLNQKPNLLKYISVQDESDPNISSKIEYDESSVDYTKEGIYPVKVTATNSSNLSSVETLFVTVTSPSSSQVIENSSPIILFPILIGICIIACGIVIFLYLRKKKNCNQEKNQL